MHAAQMDNVFSTLILENVHNILNLYAICSLSISPSLAATVYRLLFSWHGLFGHKKYTIATIATMTPTNEKTFQFYDEIMHQLIA